MWQSIVKGVAPVLGTALGGPLGGMAAKAITGALLGEENATDDLAEAEKAINNASAEDLIKIKEAEQKFALAMKNADIRLEKVHSDDRDSARKRQVKTKDKIPGILGLLIVFGFFGLLGTMMFVDIPDENETVLNIMLGALGILTGQVGNYYFGSSSSSQKKNDMLAAKVGV